jgi:NADH-quinone oxidoreductase subunit N
VNWTQPDITWAPLTPILVVLLAGAVGILVEAFVRTPATRRLVQFSLTLGALVVALGAAIWLWATQDGAGTVVLRLMLVVDRQSLAWQVLLAVFGILAALLFAARTRRGEEEFTPLGSSTPGALDETRALRAGLQVTEVFPLLLFAAGGMMLFTAVTDFVFLFVVLELFSLPLYILVALARRRRALSHEAALKYFLLGAFSSAIFIFGVALLFGATTQTSFTAVQRAIEIIAGHDPLIIAAAVLILVGLFFKLGAVPFHSWVPDVYQGAPTAVTGFMAAATKAAAVAALLRVVFASFYPLEWELNWLFWTIAIVTMLLATVVALVQTDIKRMLAYSSVAHAGFILVAFAGFSPAALSSLPFYMLAYGLATFGAFAVVTQVRERTPDGAVGAEATRLGQWAGLGKRAPWLATAMALFLLSFAGIPLTAGFVGKFVVFRSAIEQGAWPLVLVAVLASAAAAFFYVRLIVLMFFTDVPEGQAEAIEIEYSPLTRTVVVVTAVLTLALGIVPGPALAAAEDAGVMLSTLANGS